MNAADGEIRRIKLDHRNDDVGGFYQGLHGEVIVGLEASGYSTWFEQMLEGLGYEVWIGDASEIRRLARRRQKNDDRDADHILDLMVRGDFPRVHRPSKHSLDVLRQLRYRHKLVRMRTMVANSLNAIAISSGLSQAKRLKTKQGRRMLEAIELSPVMAEQRTKWLEMMDTLSEKIEAAEKWLKEQAAGNEGVQRLQTHPGIGLLSSLGLVHTLEPIDRFSTSRKVVAYVGLDPMEYSSADKKRYGSVSKAGSKLVRFLLVEAGQTAARKDPQLRSFYQRVSKRRDKRRAKVAVARKLAVRCFILMRDRIDYQEFIRRGVEARSSRVVHRP
jgi:transposase